MITLELGNALLVLTRALAFSDAEYATAFERARRAQFAVAIMRRRARLPEPPEPRELAQRIVDGVRRDRARGLLERVCGGEA